MKVSDFSRFILPEVIGCPDPMVSQAVIQTVFEFCEKSGAWDEVQDPQSLSSGVCDYDIDAPSGAILLRVRDAWVDGHPLGFAPLQKVNHMATEQGTPTHFNASIDRSQIRIFPAPAASGGQLAVRAVYAPSMTATSIPDFLLQRHAEGIAAGVKSRLMLMPSVSWSNPELGSFYLGRFTAWMVDARIESLHERVEGSLKVQTRPFM